MLLIEKLRIKSGLSKADVSRVLEVDPSLVTRVEKGKRVYTPIQLKIFCKLVKGNYEELTAETIAKQLEIYTEKLWKNYLGE